MVHIGGRRAVGSRLGTGTTDGFYEKESQKENNRGVGSKCRRDQRRQSRRGALIERQTWQKRQRTLRRRRRCRVPPTIPSSRRVSYRKARGSIPLPPSDEEYVRLRINRMTEAEGEDELDTSHAIRTELRVCYEIVVDDVSGLWSARGDSGRDPPAAGDDDEDSAALESVKAEDEGSAADKGVPRPDVAVAAAARLSKLTVPLLKEKLREAGLPVSGRKAELIDRLVATEIEMER